MREEETVRIKNGSVLHGSRSTFYHLSEQRKNPSNPNTIHITQCPRKAIYTFTSTPPAGSPRPVFVSVTHHTIMHISIAYLELDLSLGNVLFATASAGNLLSLCDLVLDGLSRCVSHHPDAMDRCVLRLTSGLKSSNA